MIISDLIDTAQPPKYISSVLPVTGNAIKEVDDNQIIVLHPDADNHTLTINPIKSGFYVVLKNDSLFSIIIKQNNESFVMIAGGVYKMYIFGKKQFKAIEEKVDDGLWETKFKITTGDDAVIQDRFGQSVSISGDGTRFIAGSPSQDIDEQGPGKAFIFIWSGSEWVKESIISAAGTNLDYFGWSVSMNQDGTRVVVGARGDITTGIGSGAAYVFTRSGTTWTQESRLSPNDGASSDKFGTSVSISGDGTRVVVGSPESDDNSLGNSIGAAYVFTRSGTTWTQEQKFRSVDSLAADRFGISVSMDADGTRCVIGAYLSDVRSVNGGAAYVFSRSGTAWTEEADIYSTDSGIYSQYGWSVSMSGNGDRVVIGCPKSDENGNDSGVSYTFTRSGTTWTKEQKIIPSVNGISYIFGWSVSMSSDGVRMAITGKSSGFDSLGRLFIFKHNGSSWIEELYDIIGPGGSSGGIFDGDGESISINGSGGIKSVTGAPFDNDEGSATGAVYIYTYI